MAIFTAVLTVATIVLGWATIVAAKAAKKAADAIPVLERAYVYPIIESENISAALDLAERKRTNPMTVPSSLVLDPIATMVFKNFGKTPATLVSGEVYMGVIGVTRGGSTTDLPIKYRYVLGEGEESEPFKVELSEPLTSDEAQRIADGRYGLVVGGFMNYRDIWGNDQCCRVGFKYNVALKRLDAHIPTNSRTQKT